MRKYTTSNGTFYYPELNVNLVDTEELKIIVENPVGYVEGDLVRLFYTLDAYFMQIGVNTFEMFSPLINSEGIKRAIFYLPLSAEFANDSFSFTQHFKQTEYFIKTKGSTDFSDTTSVLDTKYSNIYLTTRVAGIRSNPIPVFFFSERGAGLFANKILNRQLRVADTNFSSVAIRQDKFNPFDMDIEGRNYLKDSATFDNNWAPNVSSLITIEPSDEAGINQVKHIGLAYLGQDTSVIGFDFSDTAQTFTITVYAKAQTSGTIGLTLSGSQANYLPKPLTQGWAKYVWTFSGIGSTLATFRFYVSGASEENPIYIKKPSFLLGDKAADWSPNPEDYEVTELVSGADLAGGLAKFDSSYAFKLLDDSEWVAKKLICPEDHIQLFWSEPRTETRFSFWFKIKEIEKSSEAWGEVEHYRELRTGTDVKERRKEVTKYRFPKTKLRLTSGVFRQNIIDKLKGIAHSTTIYKYNPYTKLNEGRGVIAQVTELRKDNGIPAEQVGTGHFKLNNSHRRHSNTIEELINSPESVFDLEFTFKGEFRYVSFVQNRDDLASSVLISSIINEPDFTKKTFNASITIDRGKKVKPALIFAAQADTPTEIKDIYIKGSLGAIEDVEVEIATMNIIPHQDGEGEMELTVISDDFRKPDYLYF